MSPWIGFRPGSADHLPEGLQRGLAILARKERKGDVSVSELVDPVQISILRRRYDYQSEPEEMIWALLGKAVHLVIEKGMGKNELGEETLTTSLDGVTVEGTPDLWDETTVTDFKTTSVWSAMDQAGPKPEWKTQLNLYAVLLREHGFPIESGQVIVLYRDWRPREQQKYAWYPRQRLVVMPVTLLTAKAGRADLLERVERWKMARERTDDGLAEDFPCTEEEPWGGGRCESYCPARMVCRQLVGRGGSVGLSGLAEIRT